MDPATATVLEELRQAGAFMPGTLPAAGFGFPSLATPAAAEPAPPDLGPYVRQLPAPGLKQPRVIEHVKAMMASPDPVQRVQAQSSCTNLAGASSAPPLTRQPAALPIG